MDGGAVSKIIHSDWLFSLKEEDGPEESEEGIHRISYHFSASSCPIILNTNIFVNFCGVLTVCRRLQKREQMLSAGQTATAWPNGLGVSEMESFMTQ